MAGGPLRPAAAAADSVESAGDVGGLRRLHPLTPLLKGWKVLAVLLAAIGQDAVRRLDLEFFALQLVAGLLVGAVLGLASWWFTKYRIDGPDLRVDTGFLFRRSRRVRIDRVQAVDIVRPVLARVLGLAELRLEVAGGGHGDAPLAYLTEDGAQRLRAELLARAAGLDADTPEAPERRLVSVPGGVLFASAILSAPFLVAAAGFLAVTGATVALRQPFGLALLAPWAVGGLGILWRQFVGEFGFTVSESPDGLRIRKGLLDTWAQTVPPGRVQAIQVEQQLCWRPKGWVRLSVNVAGYGMAHEEGQAAWTLLPVAPWPVARMLLGEILPGVDLDAIERAPAPRRVAWLRPVGRRYLRYGADPRVFVADQGWLTRRTFVVPHGKTQSVRLTQGPLQRRLAVATVHVDTPVGPVRAVARHRDAGQARAIAEEQAERARQARRTAGPERWMRGSP